MSRLPIATAVSPILPGIVAVCQAFAGGAQAADSSELWPELSAFVQLNDDMRVYLDASFAGSRESDTRTLDLSAYLDVSLKPVLRPGLWSKDWQRSRYLWSRIGYTRVLKDSDGSTSVSEDRGVVSIYGKAELPAEVWLEGRARADLRWIGGDFSMRYRLKFEATREFSADGLPLVPYANVEWFYDTRYDSWSRTLGQVGVELTLSKHLRTELYLARQVDRAPSPSSLDALGLVAKWYY